MIFWISLPGLTRIRPHAFVIKTDGIQISIYVVSISKRDRGLDAIYGPNARFSEEPAGMTQTQPHALAPKTGGIESSAVV